MNSVRLAVAAAMPFSSVRVLKLSATVSTHPGRGGVTAPALWGSASPTTTTNLRDPANQPIGPPTAGV